MPQAEALARGYDLCSELFSFPMSKEMEAIARSVEPFAGLIPPDEQAEHWAVRHQSLFGFEIFPYAGVYLDHEGMLGGTSARACEDHYLRSGFESPTGGSESDHVCVQLDFMAYLLRRNDRVDAPEIEEFLLEQLLVWMPPFLIAVQGENDPLYRQIAETTWDLLVEHAGLLSSRKNPVPADAEQELKDGTDSKELSRFLMNASASGWFVSRSTITRWSRKLQLPRGFGSREQMLEALFDAANRYDEAEAIFVTLSDSMAAWDHHYQRMTQDSGDAVQEVVSWWRDRLRSSRKHLREWYSAKRKPDKLPEG